MLDLDPDCDDANTNAYKGGEELAEAEELIEQRDDGIAV